MIPARLRRRFGLAEGTYVIAEEREDGILLRPAELVPVEIYTPERMAEFILGSALSPEDYARACVEVKALGVDPDAVDHVKPRHT